MHYALCKSAEPVFCNSLCSHYEFITIVNAAFLLYKISAEFRCGCYDNDIFSRSDITNDSNLALYRYIDTVLMKP